VDAECTHDGSIRHIQKFENWGWTTLQRRVLDAERTNSLTVLQVSDSLCIMCMLKILLMFMNIIWKIQCEIDKVMNK
jgi:hypothetical protein